MKTRKVTLVLEIATDLPLGRLRKTRHATLRVGCDGGYYLLGDVAVQQATASVVQPVPTTKKGAKGGNAK